MLMFRYMLLYLTYKLPFSNCSIPIYWVLLHSWVYCPMIFDRWWWESLGEDQVHTSNNNKQAQRWPWRRVAHWLTYSYSTAAYPAWSRSQAYKGLAEVSCCPLMSFMWRWCRFFILGDYSEHCRVYIPPQQCGRMTICIQLYHFTKKGKLHPFFIRK